MTRILTVLLLLVLASGCLPRTIVRKNPDLHDKGVRYYRPKPYLKIAPHVSKDQVPSSQFVSVELAYLPDFSEEYSIHIKSGLGTNHTSITLDQGWNLTSLNVDIDSQTAENIEAVGSLLSSAAGLATRTDTGLAGHQFVVAATNVPIGYYEAVLGQHCGRKHLYGFRYLGFLPYASCPQVACGNVETFDCQAHSYDLYGLVFENGHMTFKHLGDVSLPDEKRLNRWEKVEHLQVHQPSAVANSDQRDLIQAESIPTPE